MLHNYRSNKLFEHLHEYICAIVHSVLLGAEGTVSLVCIGKVNQIVHFAIRPPLIDGEDAWRKEVIAIKKYISQMLPVNGPLGSQQCHHSRIPLLPYAPRQHRRPLIEPALCRALQGCLRFIVIDCCSC